MQRIISIIALLAAITVNARTVNEQEASRIAENFFLSRGLRPSLNAAYLKNTTLSRTAGNFPVHIFNAEDGGFVIISGDDRMKPVLAYSLENKFDTENPSQPCIDWLNQYISEIETIPESAESSPAAGTTEYPAAVIEPIIKTLWNQDTPYNNSCPADINSGRKCLTGCVATATAQIMNFYRYPLRGTGTVTYEDKAQKVNRTIDFDSRGDIDWENIPTQLPFPVNDKQNNAVAELIMQVGHAVKMQYSPDVSIAYHRDAAAALINNFSYDPNIHHYERAYISENEWIKLLVDELSANRPILYDGRSAESGGHSFVCDGYDGNGMFHFNWGWGGLGNGYYTLSALNPANGSGIQNYTGSQTIECRIMPPGAGESVPQTDHLLGIYSLNVFTDKTEVFDPALTYTGKRAISGFIFYCLNMSRRSFEGNVYATTVIDGKITPVSQSDNAIAAGSNSLQTLYMNPSLPDGIYTIKFHYRLPGDETFHQIRGHNDEPCEAVIRIEGNNITYGNGALSSIQDMTKDEEITVRVSGAGITVASASGLSEIRLTDINGRLISRRSVSDDNASIDISGLSRGAYILHIVTATNNQIVKKIIL